MELIKTSNSLAILKDEIYLDKFHCHGGGGKMIEGIYTRKVRGLIK